MTIERDPGEPEPQHPPTDEPDDQPDDRPDDQERSPFERPPYERDPEAQRAPGAGEGDADSPQPPMQAGADRGD
jgi:hypothetical protein